MVKVSLSLIKELKWLIGFFGLTSAAILTHFEYCLDLILQYDIHIFLLSIFGFWFIFTLINTKMINLENCLREDMQKKDSDIIKMIKEMHIDQTKIAVKELARKLHDVEVIDKIETIKYVYDLEKSVKSLGINSYTQDAVESMKKRIRH